MNDIVLTPIEARILACLIEKEITTPAYYPMTLNALTAACNQKSNRSPIMALAEKDVLRSLDTLRMKKVAWQITSAGSRVPKYRHDIESQLNFLAAEKAIMCELILRGPQTCGEVRTHAARLHPFPSVESVQQSMEQLVDWDGRALVVELPREPGRRENRYAHQLCGVIDLAEYHTEAPEPVRLAVQADDERIRTLEDRIEALESGLNALETQMTAFVKQFE